LLKFANKSASKYDQSVPWGAPLEVDKNIRLYLIIALYMLVNRNMYYFPTSLVSMSRIFGIFDFIYFKPQGNPFKNVAYNVFTKGSANGQESVSKAKRNTKDFFGQIWKDLKTVKDGAKGILGVVEKLDIKVWKIWMDNTEIVNKKACRMVFGRVIEGKQLPNSRSMCEVWASDMVNIFSSQK
jgi:hypothetical protein